MNTSFNREFAVPLILSLELKTMNAKKGKKYEKIPLSVGFSSMKSEKCVIHIYT
jgi:hypothetical protein